jgi:hypothetical protein
LWSHALVRRDQRLQSSSASRFTAGATPAVWRLIAVQNLYVPNCVLTLPPFPKFGSRSLHNANLRIGDARSAVFGVTLILNVVS